jgi:hypothetical protein
MCLPQFSRCYLLHSPLLPANPAPSCMARDPDDYVKSMAKNQLFIYFRKLCHSPKSASRTKRAEHLFPKERSQLLSLIKTFQHKVANFSAKDQ